jgi:hypothetical protein
MIWKIVGVVISMGIFVAGLAGAARAQNSPGVVGMDSALRGAVERNDVPGVVALLTDRRRVLYQGAFGVADVSTGRALTPDALFRIASMTKAITSVAAMQLIEQGRFGLDDPVENYCRSLQTSRYLNRSMRRPALIGFARHPGRLPFGTSSPIRPGLGTRSRARSCGISSRSPGKTIRLAVPCCSTRAGAGITARAPM